MFLFVLGFLIGSIILCSYFVPLPYIPVWLHCPIFLVGGIVQRSYLVALPFVPIRWHFQVFLYSAPFPVFLFWCFAIVHVLCSLYICSLRQRRSWDLCKSFSKLRKVSYSGGAGGGGSGSLCCSVLMYNTRYPICIHKQRSFLYIKMNEFVQ